MRAVGIDLGQRRIGVAVTDAGGRLALPYRVLERSGDAAADRAALAGIVEDVGAGIVVVGLPVSLSGAIGPAAERAAAEAAALGEVLDVPVVTFDERLTTVEASRRRREAAQAARSGASEDRGGRGGQRALRRRRVSLAGRRSSQLRAVLDADAAAIMLSAWLVAER